MAPPQVFIVCYHGGFVPQLIYIDMSQKRFAGDEYGIVEVQRGNGSEIKGWQLCQYI
jgi:hypothetical protein